MPYKTITNVFSKTYNNEEGPEEVLSFVYDEYTQKQFHNVPLGTFIQIRRKKPEYIEADKPNRTHWMSYNIEGALATPPGSQNALPSDTPF